MFKIQGFKLDCDSSSYDANKKEITRKILSIGDVIKRMAIEFLVSHTMGITISTQSLPELLKSYREHLDNFELQGTPLPEDSPLPA